jgi:hypothetical protein
MTPVDQEFLSRPDIGQYGDCQRAVIASLLDLPISEVPHFLRDAGGDYHAFNDNIQKFLHSKGYLHITFDDMPNAVGCDESRTLYHAIYGPSPHGNGLWHAVVGKCGAIEFDPHPSRAGLLDPTQWRYAFIVKV